MKTLTKWWKAESAMIAALALAAASVVTLPGVWGKLLGAVLPVLAGGAVRSTVWAPDTATKAVQDAASSVASQLTPEVVGAAGTVPVAAQAIVDGVTSGVVAAH